MFKQRSEVRGGGANYSTELAGRDRFKFFRRPVEPSGGELHAGDEPAASAESGNRHASTWNSAQVHYASSVPAAASLTFHGTSNSIPYNPRATGRAGQRRPSSVEPPGAHQSKGRKSKRAKMYHLPTLPAKENRFASTMPSSSSAPAAVRDCAVQTVYRENEAQTDPYSPDYYIPDGAPEPEILKLQGLTAQNGGLPAGKEEVELIQRLRRRREVEAALPTGNDEASIEERFRQLHALEEEEWRDREAHVEHLQSRRLDRIKTSLLEREAAREEATRERLETIKQQYLSSLAGKLGTMHSKSLADQRRAMDKKIARNKAAGINDVAEGAGSDYGQNQRHGGAKPGLLESYVSYGARAAPPVVTSEQSSGAAATATQGALEGTSTGDNTKSMTYDVRPVLLTVVEGVEEVDQRRAGRIERVPEEAFTVPENEAIARLPTLYQRHEAERVVQSLERAHQQILREKVASGAAGDDVTSGGGTQTGGALMQIVSEEVNAAKTRSVLDLYRAPPKVQRPPTPVLELDGDAEEDHEEACILLQRLLRGRAVQNDFFEGKERCRGLIQELQAASDAKEAEQAVADVKELEALAAQQESMVDDVLSAAVGDIIGDTLGYLYQELDRQRDVRQLEALRAEAESVRKAREATELARREAERVQREKQELQYAALVRATRHNATAFLEAARAQAVRTTAMAVAVEAERDRQSALPAPRDPAENDTAGKEDLVCDMLDDFVIPAIVDSIQLRDRHVAKQAPRGAAEDVGKEVIADAASSGS